MSKEKSQSMVDIIRQRVESSASSMKIFFRLKAGDKRRIRILTEMTEATRIVYHDKWGDINTPCLKYFGKKCKYCGDRDYRTRDQFAFSVYDYEFKDVFILICAANDNSPIPRMLEMYDEYGTLLDRDYTISRKGKGVETSYGLVPADRAKFKGKGKYSAFDEDEIFERLKEKWENDKSRAAATKADDDEIDDYDDEEDEEPKKNSKPKPKPKKKYEDDDEEDDDFDDEDEEDEEEEDDEDDDDEDEDEKPVKKKKKR